jgi:hypothetical protein
MKCLVKKILVNSVVIVVEKYTEEIVNSGLHEINVEFKVTSEDYHDITTLLYEETFDIKIPERDLSFPASIKEYSTSITNLYEKGQVGDYKLCLVEINK